MRLRIFVIDDEQCITDTMQWHLEDQGHEVICAPDPTLCSVYQGRHCDHERACSDILFVDKNMPNMDGLTFVEHMVKKGCKGLTRNMVVMSGSLDPEDFARAKALGCKVANKPVSLEEIDRLVAEMKENIHPERELADLSAA